MQPRSTQPLTDRPQATPRRRFGLVRAAVLAVLALGVMLTGGFVAFLMQLRVEESKPSRVADGIVVLTGGSSRVSDAVELLASGYGKRLLISGVHRTNGASDISRSVPESKDWFGCCVDLDRSAVNTRSNAVETRRWATERGFRSLIVVTSNYHMPRAIAEMSHVMPDIELIPFSVIGDKWRDEVWWSSGATMRLLLSEYAKYLAVEARVRLARLGIEIAPESPEQAPETAVRRPTTALAN
ncbi:YdcF family protein [Rhodopseudomonas telluris]|uniref:YdcF family protein n=1 Tax=Rhodopseudomonas telluris TaxID=644215 RepID=A0ABV6ELE7_9BRAD